MIKVYNYTKTRISLVKCIFWVWKIQSTQLKARSLYMHTKGKSSLSEKCALSLSRSPTITYDFFHIEKKICWSVEEYPTKEWHWPDISNKHLLLAPCNYTIYLLLRFMRYIYKFNKFIFQNEFLLLFNPFGFVF